MMMQVVRLVIDDKNGAGQRDIDAGVKDDGGALVSTFYYHVTGGQLVARQGLQLRSARLNQLVNHGGVFKTTEGNLNGSLHPLGLRNERAALTVARLLALAQAEQQAEAQPREPLRASLQKSEAT